MLAIIPARGGSKGLPRKNVLPLAGKPLIAWTIEAAREAESVTRTILSSDCEEIIETAKAHGCEVPFVRPPELADDEASTIDVVLHALERVGDPDYLILLQPTSPLRTGRDIDEAFAAMRKAGASSCVSVCEVPKSPYWMYHLDENQRLRPVVPRPVEATRRQNTPPAFLLNGAIYIVTPEKLRRDRAFLGDDTLAHVMPAERSVDIDDANDMALAERILARPAG